MKYVKVTYIHEKGSSSESILENPDMEMLSDLTDPNIADVVLESDYGEINYRKRDPTGLYFVKVKWNVMSQTDGV